MAIIEVKNITKKYQNVKAVNDMSFEIREGEILGILGPNGAGKSTLISLILGIISADSGEIKYKGEKLNTRNMKEYKKRVGFVPQDLAYFPELTAKDNVTFWGRIYGIKGDELKTAVERALRFAWILDRQNDTPLKYSGGMKRRLNIACGIVHSPEILFLDEPTVGIDPQSRNHILNSIKELNELGTTIVYSSHYMEEVENISDRVMIMDHGQVVASGTTEELIDHISKKQTLYLKLKNYCGNEILSGNIPGVSTVTKEDDKYCFVIENNSVIVEVINKLTNMGADIESVDMQKKNLEDVFFHYTGTSFRDN